MPAQSPASAPTPSSHGLVGRGREVAALTRLIDDVRLGESRVLVVRGDAGIGKTALVGHVLHDVAGVRVLRAGGVESEMELPYAALHQLCGPALHRLPDLPEPQRDALATVFGLRHGEVPDRLLVGLGVLTLLASLGAERPLICVIDDAQWLDHASAQAVAFAARRLLADPVGLVFCVRDTTPDLIGLPELALDGLSDHDARALLEAMVPVVLDTDVRARVLAEARGNPLALLELPRSLPAATPPPAADAPIPASIEDTYRRRIEALPAETRLLMLVAAAEPAGDPVIVLRAAASLGIAAGAAVAAEDDGLLELGVRVRFRHPLVRSAAYGAASASERLAAHRALAEVTDGTADPDRRAWHLAQATRGPDEAVADELERSAGRAQSRGGLAAAGTFLERAAALSVGPSARARRALDAAHCKHLAGAVGSALEMLAVAEQGPLEEADRARADLLRAEIAYTERRGRDVPGLLVQAAQRLQPVSPTMARATHLDAVVAAHFAGRLARGTGLREAAGAARRAPPAASPAAASDILLDGLSAALLDGYAAGAPQLRLAVQAFRGPDVTPLEELRWLWPAAHIAMALWDDESYEVLSARHIEVARGAGMLAVLPTALTTRAVAHAFFGELTEAERLLRELHLLTGTMGIPTPSYGSLFVAAWRGREAVAAETIDTAVRDNTERGEGAGLAFAEYARAVIGNGTGGYHDALAASAAISTFESDGFVIFTAGLVELVEAAARSGSREQAVAAFDRLREVTRSAGTDWALGVEARSHALVTEGDDADDLYQEAIARLGRTRVRPQLARAHLVYGEWLRREKRRTSAREHLRAAYDLFVAMGTEAFADRARHELVATGETVRRRSVATVTELTAQEAHIARLAVDGRTNPEIGAQLFISARTVEWHLRKVFTKLGISSRRELRAALPQLDDVGLIA